MSATERLKWATQLHQAHKQKVAENKAKLEEMGLLPKRDPLSLKCPYCPREFKKRYAFDWHVWIHESKFGYWQDGSPTATNIGKCSECGAFVIAPNRGVDYGSIRRLREEGFTGDIDSIRGLYCFKCMKKLGWQWGEKDEEEEE